MPLGAGETRFMRVETLAKLLVDSSVDTLRLRFKASAQLLCGPCHVCCGARVHEQPGMTAWHAAM
jgi:hypothetical protein